MRGQSRQCSVLEALTNTCAGFGLSVALGQILFPLFGASISLEQNFVITAAFTVLSFVRSYVVRRVFNWIDRAP